MRDTFYTDGCKYIYEVDMLGEALVEVRVYDQEGIELLVSVGFDHVSESAGVYGNGFGVCAPYYDLKDQSASEIASWAVVQWETLS